MDQLGTLRVSLHRLEEGKLRRRQPSNSPGRIPLSEEDERHALGLAIQSLESIEVRLKTFDAERAFDLIVQHLIDMSPGCMCETEGLLVHQPPHLLDVWRHNHHRAWNRAVREMLLARPALFQEVRALCEADATAASPRTASREYAQRLLQNFLTQDGAAWC